MAKVVESAKVNREKIPWLVFQIPSGSALHRCRLSEDASYGREPFRDGGAPLIQLVGARNEWQQLVALDFRGMNAESGQRLPQVGWRNNSLRQWPFVRVQ